MTTEDDSSPSDPVRLGHFHILGRIGAGGMGIVYLGYDDELDRPVAIKLLRASLDAAGEIDAPRLMREAQALARLSHPNVVQVHEIGRHQGQLFVAMEYVQGKTLQAWMREHTGPRPWRQVLDVYIAAGRGLAAAHDAGLIHRDFKPGNVILGDDGRVRVLDFGLVGSLAASRDGTTMVSPSRTAASGPLALATPLTMTGDILGTPAYMAPEQINGQRCDARTDQFSFCVALFEALYGVRPYAGATVWAVLEASERGNIQPPPPGSRVPTWLYNVVIRGLSPAPEERWPSMAALLHGLEHEPRRPLRWIAIATAGVGAVGVAAGLMRRTDCTAPTPDATDLYVDASAPGTGTGTASCPARTLTAALAVPSAGEPRTIHVAAGVYDHTIGERFPLVVRGAVSIVGAGEGVTRIVGFGNFDHAADGGVLHANVTATFVIGDAHAQISITDLSIANETDVPDPGVAGVVCDRGTMASFEGVPPAPNTRLARLSIGPGFGVGIIATSSTRPRPIGCNLELLGSTLKRSHVGVWVAGCGGPSPDAPVQAVIGDGSETGRNSFSELRAPGGMGRGVLAWDCTRSLVIRGNGFGNSDGGIEMIRHIGAPRAYEVVIEDNQISHMSRFGVSLERAAVVDRFDDNWIFDVAGRFDARTERGVALILDAEHERGFGFPQIRRARHNTIADNDSGIELRGADRLAGRGQPLLDFGRPGDPGRNRLGCNSTERGAAEPGYDLLIAAPGEKSATLELAGNTWDHAPPRIGRANAANGTDIVLSPGLEPTLDVTGARVSPDACRRE